MTTMRVGVAYPDPPFNGVGDDRGGLDIDLMEEIGAALSSTIELLAYEGSDFTGIFDELGAGRYDCIIAGTTVTPERQRRAAFARPYLISGQSLAVNAARFPRVHSIDDLADLTVGVQQGNTSQPIVERLVAEGRAGAVRVYDYGDIRTAATDLTTGACDAFMKLAPVLTELVRALRDVDVVARGITREEIAIAVAPGDDDTLHRISTAQAELERAGTLQAIRRRWLGNPYLDQSLGAH